LAPFQARAHATLGHNEDVITGLEELVGGLVYEKGVEELAGRHLSDYTVRTVNVSLAHDEKSE